VQKCVKKSPLKRSDNRFASVLLATESEQIICSRQVTLCGAQYSYAGILCDVMALFHYQPEHQAVEFGLQTRDTHIKTNELRRKYLVTCFRSKSYQTHVREDRSIACNAIINYGLEENRSTWQTYKYLLHAAESFLRS
jgi:hypothetical protein